MCLVILFPDYNSQTMFETVEFMDFRLNDEKNNKGLNIIVNVVFTWSLLDTKTKQ